MIKSLMVDNFTVFSQAKFQFSPQINVVAGENGSGKSHLLKLLYSTFAVSAEEGRKPNALQPTKNILQSRIAEKILAVFRPESLGRLASRVQGHKRCEIACAFDDTSLDLQFSFATQSKSEVQVDLLPTEWVEKSPVFLPTSEILTIYPGFVSFYEGHYLDFDETLRDTCLLLGKPAFRGPREAKIREMLLPLEEMMGGKIILEAHSGRFYLDIPGQGKLEMPLVAEGLRKLAMLARLIATGNLLDKGYLFWDEPEAHLNPRLIKQVARSILLLGQNGIQVFIATHSLFLLRELDILLQTSDFQSMQPRFFGLQIAEGGVSAQQGDSVDDIGSIAALDEELMQSDRYMAIG